MPLSPQDKLRRKVERYAASLSGELSAKILQSWEVIRTSLRPGEMAALLESGAIEGLVSKVAAQPDLERMFGEVGTKVTDGTLDAAKRYTLDLPTPISSVVNSQTFNVLNPIILDGVRTLNSRVLSSLSTEVADTIRQAAAEGIRQGVHPNVVARRIRDSIGLAPNQEAAVRNFERMLREGDRDALSRALRDKRFDRTLNKALGKGGTGLSEAQVQKMSKAYRRKMISYNAQTQAKSAAMDAQRLGQRLSWEDAISKGVVDRKNLWKMWSGVLDSVEREEHVNMEGETVHFDAHFSNGEREPGDTTYNCRCLAQYFVKEAALGKTPSPPRNKYQPSPEAAAKAKRARELYAERKKIKAKLARQKRKKAKKGRVPRAPDSGMHGLDPNLDFDSIQGRGKSMMKMRVENWDGKMETRYGTLPRSGITQRRNAMVRQLNKDFGVNLDPKDVNFYFNRDDFYDAWAQNSALSRAARLEKGGPAPAFARPDLGKVFIGPEVAEHLMYEKTSWCAQSWRQVAHELVHLTSGKTEPLSSGLTALFEEGATEILSMNWFRQRMSVEWMQKWKGPFSYSSRGVEHMVERSVYFDRVGEVILQAARRNGWNREAMLDDIWATFRVSGDDLDVVRGAFYKIDEKTYARMSILDGPSDDILKARILKEAETAGVDLKRVSYADDDFKDFITEKVDIPMKEAHELVHSMLLWLFGV